MGSGGSSIQPINKKIVCQKINMPKSPSQNDKMKRAAAEWQRRKGALTKRGVTYNAFMAEKLRKRASPKPGSNKGPQRAAAQQKAAANSPYRGVTAAAAKAAKAKLKAAFRTTPPVRRIKSRTRASTAALYNRLRNTLTSRIIKALAKHRIPASALELDLVEDDFVEFTVEQIGLITVTFGEDVTFDGGELEGNVEIDFKFAPQPPSAFGVELATELVGLTLEILEDREPILPYLLESVVFTRLDATDYNAMLENPWFLEFLVGIGLKPTGRIGTSAAMSATLGSVVESSKRRASFLAGQRGDTDMVEKTDKTKRSAFKTAVKAALKTVGRLSPKRSFKGSPSKRH